MKSCTSKQQSLQYMNALQGVTHNTQTTAQDRYFNGGEKLLKKQFYEDDNRDDNM